MHRYYYVGSVFEDVLSAKPVPPWELYLWPCVWQCSDAKILVSTRLVGGCYMKFESSDKHMPTQLHEYTQKHTEKKKTRACTRNKKHTHKYNEKIHNEKTHNDKNT